MSSVTLAVLLSLSSTHAMAAGSRIKALNENAGNVSFTLDAKGTPRLNGNPKSYPSIKDFREDSGYTEACYEGDQKNTRKLISALVQAADGDGDSYAKLLSIKKSRNDILTVDVEFTDERGKYDETFTFSLCK